MSLEKSLTLAVDAQAGDTRLPLESTADVTAGQQLAMREGASERSGRLSGVDTVAVIIDAPLERGATRGRPRSSRSSERVTLFPGRNAHILRRRVNTSPAQPLLEGAARGRSGASTPQLPRPRPLELDTKGAHPHEATIFPQERAALAR